MILGMVVCAKNITLLSLVSILLAETARADDLPARAVAVEARQAAALAGRSVELESQGVLMDGRKRHEVHTFRRIDFLPDRRATLTFLRGTFDGQPVDEEQLRQKITGRKKPGAKVGADLLISVLTPLSDATVTFLGPAENGGARLRAVPHTFGGKVVSVEVLVDAEGRKRAATPELGGEDFKHADQKEFTMRFDDDGLPVGFRSFTHGKFLWWEKSLEMAGHRVP
jgi:hypothetical protein